MLATALIAIPFSSHNLTILSATTCFVLIALMLPNISCIYPGTMYIIKRLNAEIENLVHQGVVNFILGMALGFDQVAVSIIVEKRNWARISLFDSLINKR